MGSNDKDGFFKGITKNVVKWWQLVLLPVLHINNDKRMQNVMPQENVKAGKQLDGDKQETGQLAEEPIKQPVRQPARQSEIPAKEEASNPPVTEKTQAAVKNPQCDMAELARQKAEQMQKEEEERRRRQVEKAKQQAQIASIMNANKVDVNAFIEAGRAAKEEKKQQAEEQAAAVKKQEDIRRAEEIIARLNREAAEDEAKKIAEIEAAKEKAKGTFC